MRRKRFPVLVFFSIMALIALVAQSCSPSPAQPQSEVTCADGASARTQGCDEFFVEQATVFKGSASSSSLPAFSGSGWNQLASNDAISTDNDGEAQLNLASCWSGRIFVFRDSLFDIKTANCDQASFDEASSTCLSSGASLAVGCGSAYLLDTGSSQVIINGTSYATIYLPEDEFTLVIPVEGAVSVVPLLSVDSGQLGEPQPVETGAFFFTMPEPFFTVDDLPPRQALPLSELPRVVEVMDLVDWAFDIHDRAEEFGVLPPEWPPELGGTSPGAGPEPTEPPVAAGGLLLRAVGGELDDARVQEALYSSVDWADVCAAIGDTSLTAYVGGEPWDGFVDLFYDPGYAKTLMAEAGVDPGFTVSLLWAAEDLSLERAAGLAAEYLADFGFDALMEGVPGSELDAIAATRQAAGEAVLIFKH